MGQLKDRLYLRGKVYWYQRFIPKEYRQYLWEKSGRSYWISNTQIQKSMKTRDYDVAIFRAKAYDLHVEASFAEAADYLKPITVSTVNNQLGIGGSPIEKEKSGYTFEDRILETICRELGNVLTSDDTTPKFTPDMTSEELIREAFASVLHDGREVAPDKTVVQALKPKLIKKLIQTSHSYAYSSNPLVNGQPLEQAADNLINREITTPLKKEMTVNEAINQWLKLKDFDPGAYRSFMAALRREYGTRAVNGITRGDIRHLQSLIEELPRNWSGSKYYKNMKPSAIVAKLIKGGMSDYIRIGHNTKQKYMRKMESFFGFAVLEGWCEVNVAAEMALPMEDAGKKYFTTEQLRALFTDYDPYQHDGWGFIPLLSLYCGARGNEAAGIFISDFYYDEDVPAIKLRHSKVDRKTGKKGRAFPLHPILIQLGFVDFIQKRKEEEKAEDDPMIFKGVYQTKTNNYYEGDVQAYMEKMLIKAGIKNDKQTYHCLRHSYKQFSSSTYDIRQEDYKTIGGWTTDKSAAEKYGDQIPPHVTIKSLRLLEFGIEDLLLQSSLL